MRVTCRVTPGIQFRIIQRDYNRNVSVRLRRWLGILAGCAGWKYLAERTNDTLVSIHVVTGAQDVTQTDAT